MIYVALDVFSLVLMGGCLLFGVHARICICIYAWKMQNLALVQNTVFIFKRRTPGLN